VHPVSYPEIIVTMHRREWLTTGPDHVRACVEAVGTWAAPWYRPRVFWPIHPHTEQILGPSGPTPILFAAPLAYDHMIDAVRHARGIVTDSGGLQEEAATLGIPCAVMRHVSDRPESIRNGLGRLFPPIPNGLTAALDWLTAYDGPRQPLDCYGTAESATAIADVLLTRPNTDAAS
jgi:UDP-N-acetylglucosamine 2-epimerase